MADKGRPNTIKKYALGKRNQRILKDVDKGYPREYICTTHNISPATLTRVIKGSEPQEK